MIRPLCKRISLIAIYLVAAHAFAANTFNHSPQAWLYDGDQLVGEVLEFGPELGEGGFGKVQKVRILDSHGKDVEKAIRRSIQTRSAAEANESMRHWAFLNPIYHQDRLGVLNHSTPGLRLVEKDAEGHQKATMAILCDLADGSVGSRPNDFWLNPKSPTFENRLNLLIKYKNVVFEGISLLAKNGLAHADIKPENVLYTTEKGFDWNNPDATKIKFSITDFDTLMPIGEALTSGTRDYAPPEIITRAKIDASPAWDVFSHAVSIFSLVFGDLPFEDFYNSNHSTSHWTNIDKERLVAYRNPTTYTELLKFAEARFTRLEKQAPTESARAKVRELRDFVMKGLARSRDERLKAFPSIQFPCKSIQDELKKRLFH